MKQAGIAEVSNLLLYWHCSVDNALASPPSPLSLEELNKVPESYLG